MRFKSTVPVLVRLVDFVLALLWGYFAQFYFLNFLERPTLSIFFYFITQTLVVGLFLWRRPPKIISKFFWDWFCAVCAIAASLFFQPAVFGAENGFGIFLQILGSLVLLGALMSLNRSFGLVPANRGIKTKGLYTYVRHPVYAGDLLIYGGYTIVNFSYYNASVLAATAFFLFCRLHNEERCLLTDKAYLHYAEHVRWRLIPYFYVITVSVIRGFWG